MDLPKLETIILGNEAFQFSINTTFESNSHSSSMILRS